MIAHRARTPALLIAASLPLFFAALASAQGGRKEYRSLNTDSHMITVQKNGQLDIALGDGTPVANDVFPMVWFDDHPAPERLKTSGAWTERTAVQDALGEGQGIHHRYKGCEWSLRAYPTRPFFVVQSGYTNESKQPVVVKALYPFCVGEPSRGSLTLGDGTDASILTGSTIGHPRVVHRHAESDDAIAALNPATGRSLVVGFITADHARSKIDIAQSEADPKKKAVAFNEFRAGCYFDPPVTLAPGESLLSEALYLSFAESDAVVGVQRYARATQIVNHRVNSESEAPLHAWILPADGEADPARTAEVLKSIGDLIPQHLVGGVLVGNPAAKTDAHPQFVTEAVARTIRGAKYEPVLWFDIIGASRPETGPLDAGNLVSTSRQYLRARGFTAIAGLNFDAPWADLTSNRIHAAVGALREGLGDGGRIYSASPSLLNGAILDGAVIASGDHSYLYPQPSRQVVWFETGNAERLRTEITAAALSRCGLLLPIPSESDAAGVVALARRALPSPAAAARPVDLFHENSPRILISLTKSIDGDSCVAAVFNWDTTQISTVRLEFAQIGLARGAFYTVYEFWKQDYLGTAQDHLDVPVPAGGVVVLVLRPLLTHPMLAATGANLGQNWPALGKVTWDPQTRRLHVELVDAADTEAARRFTLAVPSPYKMIGVESPAAEKPTWESKGNSATIVFPSEASLRQGFDAIFEVAP